MTIIRIPMLFKMQRRIPENSKIDIMTGVVPILIGTPTLLIQTGDFMQVRRQTTMTTHGDGDLLGAGMVVIAHIGARGGAGDRHAARQGHP